jgi:hypothetical protein
MNLNRIIAIASLVYALLCLNYYLACCSLLGLQSNIVAAFAAGPSLVLTERFALSTPGLEDGVSGVSGVSGVRYESNLIQIYIKPIAHFLTHFLTHFLKHFLKHFLTHSDFAILTH